MERRRTLALTVAVFAAAYYAIALFLAASTTFFTAVASVGGALACFTASAATGWAGRRALRTSRRGWTSISIGLAMWASGNTLSFLSYLTGQDTYSHAVDLLYLSAIPVLLYGLTSILTAQLPAVSLRLVLDGVIIAGSLFLVSWGTVLGAIATTEQSAVNWAIAIAYPVTDVVLASVGLLVLSAGVPGTRAALGLLCTGFLLTCAGDVGYALVDHLGNYSSSGVVNLIWFVSYELMVLGGVWAATGTAIPSSPVTVRPYTLLPYIPFALAIGTAQAVYFATGGLGPVIVVGCAALVMLVVGRQLMTLRENVALNSRLAATIAELRRREEELEHRAYHDTLTELPNRARFHARVEDAIAEHGPRVAVLYVDLDGFKAVNDKYGHATGDAVLVAVAGRLRESVGNDDHLVARLGGDEFAILLPESSDPTGLAARIVASIAGLTTVDGKPIEIGASIGIAVNQSGGRVGELLRAADLAMYAAKIEGKGRYALVGSAIAAADPGPAPAAGDDDATPARSGEGTGNQAADSSAAPNDTWNRAHQIETLVSVSKSASSGTG